MSKYLHDEALIDLAGKIVQYKSIIEFGPYTPSIDKINLDAVVVVTKGYNSHLVDCGVIELEEKLAEWKRGNKK